MTVAAYGIDGTGTLVPADVVAVTFLTGTSSAGMTVGNKVLYKGALGNLEVFDGTQANAHQIVGVSDGAAVLAGGTVTYMPVNGVLSSLSPTFAVNNGELYADDDGTLAVFSSLTSGAYTRRIGTLAKNDGTTLFLDFDIVLLVP